MARSYKRDSKGRFASGGGGGGKKAASGTSAKATRAANDARTADLKSKGLVASGRRASGKLASSYSGTRATQKRNADAWSANGTMKATSATRSLKRTGNTVNARGGQSAAQAAASKRSTKARQVAASRAANAGKPIARTDKSPVSPAKAKYQELRSKARKSSPYRTAAENKASASAKRSLANFTKKRGRK